VLFLNRIVNVYNSCDHVWSQTAQDITITSMNLKISRHACM